MMICYKCRRVMKYVNNKTSVRFMRGELYEADCYKCFTCQRLIMHTAQKPQDTCVQSSVRGTLNLPTTEPEFD